MYEFLIFNAGVILGAFINMVTQTHPKERDEYYNRWHNQYQTYLLKQRILNKCNYTEEEIDSIIKQLKSK